MSFNFCYYHYSTFKFFFLEEGAALVTKTTVTVGQDGQTHAESFIETFDVERDMTDKIKKSRKSGGRRSANKLAHIEHSSNADVKAIYLQSNHTPSAPPASQYGGDNHGKHF